MNIEIYQSPFVDPYVNLGVEESLFETCPGDTLRFYLWQNAHTVVIGKNQHAYSEVDIAKLIEDKGKLARRSSGGGAVYHDLGNLNFTFILEEKTYDVKRQMNVIADALKSLGFNAQVSGRNDIEIDGAKVSGNAFLRRNGIGLHHGTILVDVDKANLGTYLTVSEAKLKRKQVASVKARIMNLTDQKAVSIDEVKAAVLDAVKQSYGNNIIEKTLPIEGAARRINQFSSEAWLYGTSFDKQIKLETYLSFGSIRWEFEAEGGIITQSVVYSDAMDVPAIERLANAAIGQPCDPHQLADHFETLDWKDEILIELIEWLRG